MNSRAGQLIDEVLRLTPEDRWVAAAALIDNLNVSDDDSAVAKAWSDEIVRRKAELQSGRSTATPWPEARARLSAL